MKINLKKVTVRELTAGYVDSEEMGVRGFGGRLDIRPPYQREFIYDDKKRDAVITTIKNGFPLNVMYWAERDDDAGVPFEVLDGQQRTISVCQYVNGVFAYDFMYFDNLTQEEKDQILDYELMVYVCSGSDKDKLQWFKTINIAGEKLTDQELRNAVYAGPWLSDAKRYFSKRQCPAYGMGGKYLRGSAIRQDYLETVIDWISEGNIEIYMAKHQHDPNANAMWLYFSAVINWVKATFPKYRKEMKGVDWGWLYGKYKEQTPDTAELEKEVSRLMADSDVEHKAGIYRYVFNHDERELGIRLFDDNMRREAYERQDGFCPICGNHFEIEEMEADHITPWHLGGRTVADNCQMLCMYDNRRKGGK